jgi:NDP-sugar pyrophosphorylase family protein
MKAVILAGGKGTRLKPYTIVFPKPLVPINNRPILEIVIEQLAKNGIKEIIMAVGHLAELLQTFFGDGSKYGIKIEYSREDKPLGTAGPLWKIKDQLDDTFLMMNGDILTDLDYSKLIEYHENSNAVATIALHKRKVFVDYGVVETDDDSILTDWIEKPKVEYLVSMGIYILSPEALNFIPTEQFFDLPDLIKTLINENKPVKGYIYDGYWLDIGRPEDYEKALNDIESGKVI